MDPNPDPDPAVFVSDPDPGGPKNIWILRSRIREAQKHMDPTDPDPQHWLTQCSSSVLLLGEPVDGCGDDNGGERGV